MAFSFGCLPPDNEDEWLNLRHFVSVYNSINGTEFVLDSFPEVDNRNEPEPEILLRDGEVGMVIERKVFVWPPDHIRHHQLWHEFNSRFLGRVVDAYSDDLYVLEIRDVDMPDCKRDVVGLANKLADLILQHQQRIKSSQSGVCSDEPIPWEFYRLPQEDRVDAPIDFGIGVRLKVTIEHYSDPELCRLRPEIQSKSSRLIESSSAKFEKYSDCTRVLLLELYSCVINLSTDALSQIIQAIEVPSSIDQIWLAGEVEISEWERVPDYQLVMSRT